MGRLHLPAPHLDPPQDYSTLQQGSEGASPGHEDIPLQPQLGHVLLGLEQGARALPSLFTETGRQASLPESFLLCPEAQRSPLTYLRPRMEQRMTAEWSQGQTSPFLRLSTEGRRGLAMGSIWMAKPTSEGQSCIQRDAH